MTEFRPSRYDQMPYRRCGKSGLKLPALSLGGWHNFTDEAQVRSSSGAADHLASLNFIMVISRPSGQKTWVATPRSDSACDRKAYGAAGFPGPSSRKGDVQ